MLQRGRYRGGVTPEDAFDDFLMTIFFQGFTLLGIIHEVLMQFLRGTENDLSLNISSILDSNACFTIPTKTQESCGELPGESETSENCVKSRSNACISAKAL